MDSVLNGRDLSGWRFDLGADKVASGTTEWFTAAYVSWSQEAPERVAAAAVPGGIIVNGLQARTMNLVTERKFADFELYLEFMLAKRSNSGVYHHGLYEVQIFDSHGSSRPPAYSDAGGIYERWITARVSADSRRAVTPRGLPASGSSSAPGFERPASTRRERKKKTQGLNASHTTVWWFTRILRLTVPRAPA